MNISVGIVGAMSLNFDTSGHIVDTAVYMTTTTTSTIQKTSPGGTRRITSVNHVSLESVFIMM